ncbi:MAG: hypothetical protein LBF68_06550 [Christensenellaceae bacterium]|nr:hypothetical protein [Christensenellaceae bacterium]
MRLAILVPPFDIFIREICYTVIATIKKDIRKAEVFFILLKTNTITYFFCFFIFSRKKSEPFCTYIKVDRVMPYEKGG